MAFQEVLKQHPTDRTARLFLDKAAGLLRVDVPDDWTGVEVMEGK